MLNFKKLILIKIVSCMVMVTFLSSGTVYPSSLRVPAGNTEERIEKAKKYIEANKLKEGEDEIQSEWIEIFNNFRKLSYEYEKVKDEYKIKRDILKKKIDFLCKKTNGLNEIEESGKVNKIKEFMNTYLYQELFFGQNCIEEILQLFIDGEYMRDLKNLFKEDYSGTNSYFLEDIKQKIRILHSVAEKGKYCEIEKQKNQAKLSSLAESFFKIENVALKEKFIKELISLEMNYKVFSQKYIFGVLFNFMLKDKKMIPIVIPYILMIGKIYGYNLDEYDPSVLFKLIDLINNKNIELDYNLVRLLFLNLITMNSGQVRVGSSHPLRVRTRTGDYGIGIEGVIRDSLHNNLGIYCVGLIERALEYWSTGEKRVLTDADYYQIDAFKQMKIKSFSDTTFPIRVTEIDLANTAPNIKIRLFMLLLFAELADKNIKGNTNYERLRNINEEELKEIYREINKKLGTEFPVDGGRGTIIDYIWAYRFVAQRFNIGNLDTIVSNILKLSSFGFSFSELTGGDFFNRERDLYRYVNNGNYFEALREMLKIRKSLKSLIFSNIPYDKTEMMDIYYEEYGHDDVGNADGGAFIRDKRFVLYMIDRYLSDLEEIIVPELIAGYFGEISDKNLNRALELIELLILIDRQKGLAGISQEDNAMFLRNRDVSYAKLRDVLDNILSNYKNEERLTGKIFTKAVSEIVNVFNFEDLDGFTNILLTEDVEISEEKKKEMIKANSCNLFLSDECSHRILPKFTEKVQNFIENKTEKLQVDSIIEKADLKNEKVYIKGFSITKDMIEEIINSYGRRRLSYKGINLLRNIYLGIESPPFVIFPVGIEEKTIINSAGDAIKEIEDFISSNKKAGRFGGIFGDKNNPLFISIRCGGYFTLPGQLPTVTNVGMNENAIKGFADRLMKKGVSRESAYWTAWDSYRRFLEEYALAVLEMNHTVFNDIIENVKVKYNKSLKEELSYEQMKEVALKYKEEIERRKGKTSIPDDPYLQLKEVIRAIKQSWDKFLDYRLNMGITGDWEKENAIIIQVMAYGNIHHDSGSGVLYARNLNTGNYELGGDFKWVSQGSDLASHAASKTIEIKQLEDQSWFKELKSIAEKWDLYFGNAIVEIEFTVENGQVEILQVRDVYLPEEAQEFLYPPAKKDILTKGRGSSGGAYRGSVVYFKKNLDDKILKEFYLKAKKKKLDGLILVMNDLNPSEDISLITRKIKIGKDDIFPIGAVLTKKGGIASHSSDIMRDFKMTAIVNIPDLYLNYNIDRWYIKTKEIPEETTLSINGSNGIIAVGKIPLRISEIFEENQLDSRFLFTGLRRITDIEKIFKIINEIEDFSVTSRDLSILIKAHYLLSVIYGHLLREMFKPDVSEKLPENITECIRNGDYSEAIQELKTLLKVNANNILIYKLLGGIYSSLYKDVRKISKENFNQHSPFGMSGGQPAAGGLKNKDLPGFNELPDTNKIKVPDKWDSSIVSHLARFNPSLIEEAIKDGLAGKDNNFLSKVFTEMKIDKEQVRSVELLLAQEGPDYAIFNAKICFNTNEVKYFCFDIVLNDSLNNKLEADFENLNKLYNLQKKYGLKLVPQPYALGSGKFFDNSGEAVEIKFFAIEWLEYHEELYGYKDINGNGFFLLPNYIKPKSRSNKVYLNKEKSSYIRKQIIEMLTLIFAATFKEGKGMLVKEISINNGDFMALPLEDGTFDVRLITARQMVNATVKEFITYLYEHENEQYVEVKISSQGIERRIPTFKFYEDEKEIEEGITSALEKVYGEEKGNEIARSWLLTAVDSMSNFQLLLNESRSKL